MKDLKQTTKNKLMVVFLVVSMLLIIGLWMVLSPPSYFQKSDSPGLFDTVKTQFSDIF